MSEILSFIELVGMLLGDPRISVLFLLLVVAAIIDKRVLRIPNWLTAGGTVFALLYSAFVPFLSGQGFLWALAGGAIGFLALLPLYLLRAMGAGDVKLMGMTGVFLGGADIFAAILASFIVGGVIALACAVSRGTTGRLMRNMKNAMALMLLSFATGSATGTPLIAQASLGKMPFGVSIGIGTIGYVVAKHMGFF